jgi:hypothetical protein
LVSFTLLTAWEAVELTLESLPDIAKLLLLTFTAGGTSLSGSIVIKRIERLQYVSSCLKLGQASK